MFKKTVIRAILLIIISLIIPLAYSSPAQSLTAYSRQVKELNFVFLHGVGGNACSFQLLEDYIIEQLPAYSIAYERANNGIKVQFNSLKRCYPGYVDIDTWANNIAESIEKHFYDKENLILVCHSMGGKAALYAVAQNIRGMADKVSLVVTMNSPIKSLNRYYIAGGGSVIQYCRTVWSAIDEGICNSVAYYDSSEDGQWVSSNRHWLAFISGEDVPLSERFNVGGVDAWPRDMDDSIVPLSAQHSEGADVIYYGTYGHSDFAALDEVAEFIAEQILHYIFGGDIECSVFSRGAILRHEAGWLPGKDYWQDVVGGLPESSGTVQHKNELYFKWQEWEDVVGWCSPGAMRDKYYIGRVNSFPVLTSIAESRWFNPDNTADCRIYIRTRAAPRNSVQVNWSILEQGLLPPGSQRDHYEVEIVTGTPLTSITRVTWETDDPRDVRLRIWSEAERPFRWFKAEWRVYYKETRQRQVIDEIPARLYWETSPDS